MRLLLLGRMNSFELVSTVRTDSAKLRCQRRHLTAAATDILERSQSEHSMAKLPPPDELLPYFLFALPWFMVVSQMIKGLKTGTMREYLRSDYQEEGSGRGPKYLSREESPVGFWCLFGFYTLIAIIVPVGMVYAITHPREEPKPNPGSNPGEHSPAESEIQTDPVGE